MELSTELVAVLLAITLAWAGWVSIVTINNQKSLSNLQNANAALHKDMEDISNTLKESFADMKSDVKDQIDKVNTRLDIFLRDEISVLKELAKKR